LSQPAFGLRAGDDLVVLLHMWDPNGGGESICTAIHTLSRTSGLSAPLRRIPVAHTIKWESASTFRASRWDTCHVYRYSTTSDKPLSVYKGPTGNNDGLLGPLGKICVAKLAAPLGLAAYWAGNSKGELVKVGEYRPPVTTLPYVSHEVKFLLGGKMVLIWAYATLTRVEWRTFSL
jgi:hypothetical protein